jgi:hypothetical protein
MKARRLLVRSIPVPERKRVVRKPKFVAEVALTGHLEDDGKIVGSARIEQMPGGNLIAHVDASGMSAETLRRGFSLGSFTVPEDKDATPKVQLEKRVDR